MLEQLAKENGLSIQTKCICLPNYGLEDHMNDGLVAAELAARQYQFVIFQQGPSSQAYGRESLFTYGQQLAVLALAHQATPAYLMVWPSKAYYQTFEGVIKNHTDAAKANGTLLIPLGLIWQKLNQEHPEFELYGPDGFHPSPLGSFLEAVIILKKIAPETDFNTLKTASVANLNIEQEALSSFLRLVSDYLIEQ